MSAGSFNIAGGVDISWVLGSSQGKQVPGWGAFYFISGPLHFPCLSILLCSDCETDPVIIHFHHGIGSMGLWFKVLWVFLSEITLHGQTQEDLHQLPWGTPPAVALKTWGFEQCQSRETNYGKFLDTRGCRSLCVVSVLFLTQWGFAHMNELRPDSLLLRSLISQNERPRDSLNRRFSETLIFKMFKSWLQISLVDFSWRMMWTWAWVFSTKHIGQSFSQVYIWYGFDE